MTTIPKTLALMALAAASAGAQSYVDAQVRGREIVDEAIQALGGEKFLSYENRVEIGRMYSFYNSELSGLSAATIYSRYVPVAPDRSGSELAQQERQSFGKDSKEDYFVLLREEGGWEVTYRGPTGLEPEDIARMRDTRINNILYILRVRLNEPELVFEFRGGEVMDNMPVNVVDVIDSQNRVVTVYFHQTTKLPVRQDWVWREPDTHYRNEDVTRFNRYRESGGIQWPQQINRERNGDKIFEQFSETVLFNQDLDEELFAIPDASTRPR